MFLVSRLSSGPWLLSNLSLCWRVSSPNPCHHPPSTLDLLNHPDLCIVQLSLNGRGKTHNRLCKMECKGVPIQLASETQIGFLERNSSADGRQIWVRIVFSSLALALTSRLFLRGHIPMIERNCQWPVSPSRWQPRVCYDVSSELFAANKHSLE